MPWQRQLQPAFLIPPAVVVIEGALILCWAFAESILDVRELFAGGKVPLTKNASNWQLSLQGLPALVDKLDTDRQNDVNGCPMRIICRYFY